VIHHRRRLSRENWIFGDRAGNGASACFNVWVRSSSARLGSAIPDGVMRNDHRSSVVPLQRDLDDLTGGRRWSAPSEPRKRLDIFDQPILRILQQRHEHLVLEIGKLGSQEIPDDLWRRERCATPNPATEHLACWLQHFVIGCRAVLAAGITHQEIREFV
jgi:hypothetical protein